MADEALSSLCNAVMRAVVSAGVVTETKMSAAVEIMRAELKAFLFEERYAEARECGAAGSLNAGYLVGLIAAECVAKISISGGPAVGAITSATGEPAAGL